MDRYKNLGGNSSVTAFEIGQDSITVQFNDGWNYLYNNQSTGAANVEKMKNLAVRGQGLNSFISRVIRKHYARKFR